MHRKISYIRDLEIIEKELNDSSGGILAINIDGEKVIQYLTTFLYLDKNIYFFLEKEDDIYEKLNLNSSASFTVVKDERIKRKSKEPSGTYYLFSTTIVGPLKIVDEKKTIEDVKEKYMTKYFIKKTGEAKSSHLKELVMIDSEEIQAVEEEGV